jgi:hypothetical protein
MNEKQKPNAVKKERYSMRLLREIAETPDPSPELIARFVRAVRDERRERMFQ